MDSQESSPLQHSSQFLQQSPQPHGQGGMAPPPTFTPPPQHLQQPPSPLSYQTMAPPPTFTPPPQLLQQLPLLHSYLTMVPPPTSTPPPQLLQQPPPPQPHETMAPPTTPTPPPQPQPHQQEQPDNDMVPAKITFHQPQQSNLQFLFNSLSGQHQKFNLDPSEGSAAAAASQKKRGRPRKSSAAAGNPSGSVLSPTPITQIPLVANQPDSGGGAAASKNLAKRPRGRPVGSGKKRKQEALDSGAAPPGNPSGLGLFPTPVVNQADSGAAPSEKPSGLGFSFTPVVNQPDSGAAPSGNLSGLGLFPTPVVNQADSGAAPSGNPSGFGLYSTPVVNQADFGAAPSGKPSCLGFSFTPVVNQVDSGAAAPLDNPSSLGFSFTPVVNQPDSGTAAPSQNPAKKARGRPPGSGKKQHPEALDSGATASENPAKKPRGRPPGSGKKKQPEALGAVGLPMQHLIPVNIGEDIVTKVMPFSQQVPSAVCILSATGDLSKVTIREIAIGGDTVTHEGLFAIASLSGSFYMSESCRTGALSVSLFREDGSHLGGVVAGPLTAATPVQVVVSTFIPNTENPESKEPSSTPPPNVLSFGAPVTEASSPSQVPQP